MTTTSEEFTNEEWLEKIARAWEPVKPEVLQQRQAESYKEMDRLFLSKIDNGMCDMHNFCLWLNDNDFRLSDIERTKARYMWKMLVDLDYYEFIGW